MVDYNSLPGFGPVTYSPTRKVSADRAQAESALSRIPGVEGVGEGHDDNGKSTWIAYVQDASVASKLPSSLGERKVVPAMTGTISKRPVE